MSKFHQITSFSMVLGTAALSGSAHAGDNPFALSPLPSAYAVAAADSEGRCGAKAFEAMDTNKDGKISKEEFNAHKDAMFRKMDTNGDGYISKEEMMAMRHKHGEGSCGASKSGSSDSG